MQQGRTPFRERGLEAQRTELQKEGDHPGWSYRPQKQRARSAEDRALV